MVAPSEELNISLSLKITSVTFTCRTECIGRDDCRWCRGVSAGYV